MFRGKGEYLALLLAAKKTSEVPNSNEILLETGKRGGLCLRVLCQSLKMLRAIKEKMSSV